MVKVSMKLFAIAAVFLTVSAAHGLSGQRLEQATVTMGTCVGVNALDGYVLSFLPAGQAFVTSLTPESAQLVGAAASANGYSTIYANYLELGVPQSQVETTWRVSGDKVLVNWNLAQPASELSIIIGFKSQFCYVNYVGE